MKKIKGSNRLKASSSIRQDRHKFRLAVSIVAVAVVAATLFFALGLSDTFKASAQEMDSKSSRVAASGIQPEAIRQINLIQQEKESRTPTQQKIDSNLLYASRTARGEAAVPGLTELQSSVRSAADGTVDVDIIAHVNDGLLNFLEKNNVQIISVMPQYNSIVAKIAVVTVENIAERSDVVFVQPKQDGTTNSVEPAQPAFSLLPAAMPSLFTANTDNDSFDLRAARVKAFVRSRIDSHSNRQMVGSVTAESDTTHRAAIARMVAGVDGTGLKIGVMSNGVDSLAARQASGDLGTVTILSGQAGVGDEGTAMLELIHDIAPGAQLYYATANTSITSFAQNIRDLRTAGCDMIVDDYSYYVETPFQDGQAPSVTSSTNQGILIQAVNDVTQNGAQYFSSAANSGNKNDNTAGVWEGDFNDGGASTTPLPTGGTVHAFAPGQNYDIETTPNRTLLKWSDPIGGSSNDYDLYILNAAGTTVVNSSTNIQSGTQDPTEDAGTVSTANARVVIFKKTSAASRYLHLNTNRGVLSISTSGVIYGHNGGRNTISVAATPSGPVRFSGTSPVGPFPYAHSTSNSVETFSSDGPRRIFYNADNSLITPGNVSSTGGTVLQKPDITAADGSTTTTPGFIPFFGTSAAAPTAAALMSLVKQASPGSTNAQLFNAMTSSAIDIEGPGTDRDSGAGIFMPLSAMASLGVAGPAYFEGVPTLTEQIGNGNGTIDPGETGSLSIPLSNIGLANATAVSATISTSTPYVTISGSPTRTYPNLPNNTAGQSSTPFAIQLDQTFPCGATITISMTVTYSGGSTQVLTFNIATPASTTVPTQTLDTTAPANGANYTAATGIQVNRLNRNGVTSACGSAKATPNLQEAAPGTNKQYDAYTFTASSAGCVTVTIFPSNSTALFSAAYNGTFTPNAIQANYIADYGVTTAGTISYGFNVTAGQQFVVVIHEVNTGGGIGTTYSLKVDGPIAGGCSPYVPTQTSATLGGKVTANGQAVNNAIVTLSSAGGSTITRSNPFGYYSFTGVPTGIQYTISASSKWYTFPPQQITPTVDNLSIDLTAVP